jgi:hypothetical protein
MQSREINIGGIVDVAPFGMWLYGIDPNNQYGISVHFSKSFIENGDSFVDPSSAKYIFDEDGTLLVEVGNKREPIFALHNHSKNLKYFGSQGVDKLKKNYGKFTKKRAPYASFSPKIFMSLVFQKLWKRTRKSFKRSFWRNV